MRISLLRSTESYHLKKRGLDVHACELSKGSDSYLPKLLPNARLSARLKRRFQKIILVSVKHPFTKWHFRSRASIAFEKKRHGRSTHWWVIHPYSQFRFGWDVLMTFTYVYSFLVFPYMIAYHILSTRTGENPFSIIIPSYVICAADILVNFNTAYASTASHEIFLDPILIARHYAQGYFLVDLISSLPYSWWFGKYILPPGQNTNFPAIVVELLPLVKLFRLATLRTYVKQLSTVFGIHNVCEIFLWFFLLTALICHWSACLTYGYPFFTMHVAKTELEETDAWFVKYEIFRKSAAEVYLTSLHIGISNLWSSSFVEFHSRATPDETIRCLLLIFGKGYAIYIIVVVLELVVCHIAPQLQYHQIISQLNEYARETSLPKNLKDKLMVYYEYRYQGSFFKEQAITASLPTHLKHEIIVHTTRGLLDNATIFYGLPRSLTTNIMATLKPDIYLEGDVIFKCDSEGDYMYFIASGTVALITCSGTEVCHLEDGAYFGETVLIFTQKRREVTAIALEICELLRFDRRDFNRIVPPKSDFFTRLEEIARARLDLIADK